jgi:hypothetical protein
MFRTMAHPFHSRSPQHYYQQVEPAVRSLPDTGYVIVALYDQTTKRLIEKVSVAKRRAEDIGHVLWQTRVPENPRPSDRFAVVISLSSSMSNRRRERVV